MAGSRFDVLVVGAGIVGASLAHVLAQRGFSIAVVEKNALASSWDEGEYDFRVSALNLGAERMLRAADVWGDIESRRVCRYERMFVWDAGSRGRIAFDCADLGVPHLGSIVENNLILFCLHNALRSGGKAVLYEEAEVERIESSENAVSVMLRGGGTLRARVLIGADGAGSSVRELLGVKNRRRGFDQSAIVAQVGTEHGHEQTAWQRFLPTGPLAFLPLANGDSSIVWSCELGLADELTALDEAGFTSRLTDAFEARLGRVTRAGPRSSYPLATAHAESYVRERSVLIGDAAHLVHPLAGQGLNLGLADAAALAEVLVDARANGHDIGGWRALRRYERWRRGDNLVMANALIGFKRLFGSNLAAVSQLRGAGLCLVDLAGPVKHALARKAMGVTGDLPGLMSGRSLG